MTSLTVNLVISETSEAVAWVVMRQMAGEAMWSSEGNWAYRVMERQGSEIRTLSRGEVQHTYGKGPLALLHKVLEASKEDI